MSREVHLLVMIHGMWGTPKNLSEARRIIGEKTSVSGEGDGPRLEILVARTNQRDATYDGVDWGGERLADEVYEKISELEEDNLSKVTSFSVLGYSLGGLLGRYLVGILCSRDFFKNVKPVNFATFATPHIGLPRYRSLISTLAASLGPKLLSRSGKQLFLLDKWGKEERPLLEVLADKNRIFWHALSLFPHIHLYANAVSDITVPFVTAAIELEDPFLAVHTGEMEIKLDPTYSPLIESYNRIEPSGASRFSFRALGPSRRILPIFLKRGFLFETLMIILAPVLLPTALSVVFVLLARDSRASRLRVRLLEADEDNHKKLINVLDSFESAVEYYMDPAVEEEDMTASPQDASLTASQSHSHSTERDAQAPKLHRLQPILTNSQKSMVRSLNDIPQLEKHYAFLHPVQNAHGLIVCRDAELARRAGGEWRTLTKEAEGVLRHWADGFVA